MGLRGPAPKPSAIRKLEGNPSRRPFRDDEPTLPIKAPPCPRGLDAAGKRHWKKIVPVLIQMRVLTEADEIAITDLCQLCSTMEQAQKILSEKGLLVKKPSGTVVINPAFGAISQLRHNLYQLLREFGLSAASRSRIRMEDAEALVPTLATGSATAMAAIRAKLAAAPRLEEKPN